MDFSPADLIGEALAQQLSIMDRWISLIGNLPYVLFGVSSVRTVILGNVPIIRAVGESPRLVSLRYSSEDVEKRIRAVSVSVDYRTLVSYDVDGPHSSPAIDSRLGLVGDRYFHPHLWFKDGKFDLSLANRPDFARSVGESITTYLNAHRSYDVSVYPLEPIPNVREHPYFQAYYANYATKAITEPAQPKPSRKKESVADAGSSQMGIVTKQPRHDSQTRGTSFGKVTLSQSEQEARAKFEQLVKETIERLSAGKPQASVSSVISGTEAGTPIEDIIPAGIRLDKLSSEQLRRLAERVARQFVPGAGPSGVATGPLSGEMIRRSQREFYEAYAWVLKTEGGITEPAIFASLQNKTYYFMCPSDSMEFRNYRCDAVFIPMGKLYFIDIFNESSGKVSFAGRILYDFESGQLNIRSAVWHKEMIRGEIVSGIFQNILAELPEYIRRVFPVKVPDNLLGSFRRPALVQFVRDPHQTSPFVASGDASLRIDASQITVFLRRNGFDLDETGFKKVILTSKGAVPLDIAFETSLKVGQHLLRAPVYFIEDVSQGNGSLPGTDADAFATREGIFVFRTKFIDSVNRLLEKLEQIPDHPVTLEQRLLAAAYPMRNFENPAFIDEVMRDVLEYHLSHEVDHYQRRLEERTGSPVMEETTSYLAPVVFGSNKIAQVYLLLQTRAFSDPHKTALEIIEHSVTFPFLNGVEGQLANTAYSPVWLAVAANPIESVLGVIEDVYFQSTLANNRKISGLLSFHPDRPQALSGSLANALKPMVPSAQAVNSDSTRTGLEEKKWPGKFKPGDLGVSADFIDTVLLGTEFDQILSTDFLQVYQETLGARAVPLEEILAVATGKTGSLQELVQQLKVDPSARESLKVLQHLDDFLHRKWLKDETSLQRMDGLVFAFFTSNATRGGVGANADPFINLLRRGMNTTLSQSQLKQLISRILTPPSLSSATGLEERPPELGAPIRASDPETSSLLQRLTDGFVAVMRDQLEGYISNRLDDVVQMARQVKPSFAITRPNEQLTRDRKQALLQNELNEQIFLPSNQFVQVNLNAQGTAELTRWHVRESTWRSHPYLGVEKALWTADFQQIEGSRGQNGLEFSHFALVDPEQARQDAIRIDYPKIMSSEHPTALKLRSLLNEANIHEEGFGLYFGEWEVRYEEFHHAQDAFFATRRHRNDRNIQKDLDLHIKEAEALVKPSSGYGEFLWRDPVYQGPENRYFLSHSLVEYLGRLGALMAKMDAHLERGRREPEYPGAVLAYATFLSDLLMRDLNDLMLYSVGRKKLTPHVGAAQLMCLDLGLRGIEPSPDALISYIEQGTSTIAHDIHAQRARDLLQSIYDQTSWWSEEERNRVPPLAGMEEAELMSAADLKRELSGIQTVQVPSEVAATHVLIVTPDGLPKLALASLFVTPGQENPLRIEALANDEAHRQRVQQAVTELGMPNVRVHDVKAEFGGNVGEAIVSIEVGYWRQNQQIETIVVTASTGLEEIAKFLGVPEATSGLEEMKTIIDRSQSVWS